MTVAPVTVAPVTVAPVTVAPVTSPLALGAATLRIVAFRGVQDGPAEMLVVRVRRAGREAVISDDFPRIALCPAWPYGNVRRLTQALALIDSPFEYLAD